MARLNDRYITEYDYEIEATREYLKLSISCPEDMEEGQFVELMNSVFPKICVQLSLSKGMYKSPVKYQKGKLTSMGWGIVTGYLYAAPQKLPRWSSIKFPAKLLRSFKGDLRAHWDISHLESNEQAKVVQSLVKIRHLNLNLKITDVYHDAQYQCTSYFSNIGMTSNKHHASMYTRKESAPESSWNLYEFVAHAVAIVFAASLGLFCIYKVIL